MQPYNCKGREHNMHTWIPKDECVATNKTQNVSN